METIVIDFSNCQALVDDTSNLYLDIAQINFKNLKSWFVLDIEGLWQANLDIKSVNFETHTTFGWSKLKIQLPVKGTM